MRDYPSRAGRRSGRAGLLFISWFLAVFFVFSGLLPVQAASTRDLKTGKELYDAACATCHGLDGRGAPQHQLGFDLPPADFTDCNFATREPDSDWLAVAHGGGPMRGFARLMPAFGGVLTYEELSLVVTHIRTFCPDRNWPRGDLNLPRAMFTEKAFPEDEIVYTAGFLTEGSGEFSNELIYEKRFGARNQFELVVPFNWHELPTGENGADDWNGGVGDIALGVKRALFHSFEKGSIFAVTGEVIMPTGNEEKGFGKGTAIFEPFVSYGQLLPSDFFLHSQAGFEFPFDRDKAGNEAFLRMALGRSFYQGGHGRTWAPMMEVLAARELESGAKVSWDLVPQMHVTLSTRKHIRTNVAVKLPVTESSTRDTQILVFLLWDWFDGGFFQGW